MANYLTDWAPQLFTSAETVMREPFGALKAITLDIDSKSVSKGESLKVPYLPALTTTDYTPGPYAGTGSDTTAANVEITIDYSKKVTAYLTGEQQNSLNQSGVYPEWFRLWTEGAMRQLVNGVETEACLAAKKGASRSYGTPGTTPFATNLDDIARIKRTFVDNGVSNADLSLVINTAAGLNLRKLNIFQQSYMAGSDQQLRTGTFLPAFGMNILESAGIATHSAGTNSDGTNYYKLSAAASEGDVSISIDTGSGTILNGDIFSFDQDGTGPGYVAGGTWTTTAGYLNRPGMISDETSGSYLYVLGDYAANFAVQKSCVCAVVRPPLITPNPTIQQMQITDPVSGLTFLLLDISQYGQRTLEMHLAYGVKAINGAGIIVLAG